MVLVLRKFEELQYGKRKINNLRVKVGKDIYQYFIKVGGYLFRKCMERGLILLVIKEELIRFIEFFCDFY